MTTTDNDAIDVGSTEHPPESEQSVASLTPAVRPSTALVEPAADAETTLRAFRAYGKLCDDLLREEDYQSIKGKKFRKKSGWRKLAVAFGVSCELVSRDNERDETGKIVRSEIVVRATAPNGRFMDGLGACDYYERCCGPKCNTSHTHCPMKRGEVCDWSHFSHPQHDIPATAMTRATNRACSDLFGMGEVSAEEVTDQGESSGPPVSSDLDGEDAYVTTEQYQRVRDLTASLPEEVRKAITGPGQVFGVQVVEERDGERVCVLRQSQYQPIIDKLNEEAEKAQRNAEGEADPNVPPQATTTPEDGKWTRGDGPECSKCASTNTNRVVHEGAVVCQDPKGCAERAKKDAPFERSDVACGGNTGKGCGEIVPSEVVVYDDEHQPFHPDCADFLG